MKHRDLDVREAEDIAKRFKVKLPKVGYEVSLGGRRWLRSTGHAEFGWIDKPVDIKPFELVCSCDETLRPGEPRGCPTECPNKETT